MDFARARHNMVEGQIRTNKVTDTLVVDVLDELPREVFVADSLKSLAYIDEDLMVGPGRILMEPMVLARMMQAAAIEETDLALVIAAATGYEAAAIAKIASAVVAIESDSDLHRAAMENLAAQGADTVSMLKGDLAKGHPGQGPYDVIFINGAAAQVPASLIDQLADGGRLVYVKPGAQGIPGTGKAMLVSKADGVVSEIELFDANVPALPEFAAKPQFSF
ncbi:protein-L-isoaspartate O-methyltransferase [Magnetovibrio sp.]|uniref:protein-L-isoaspartate O-methyltransferase family protein n=1 Tax=Magnetovibrio sp. TaxID=2024836 RepID=UPI002F929975